MTADPTEIEQQEKGKRQTLTDQFLPTRDQILTEYQETAEYQESKTRQTLTDQFQSEPEKEWQAAHQIIKIVETIAKESDLSQFTSGQIRVDSEGKISILPRAAALTSNPLLKHLLTQIKHAFIYTSPNSGTLSNTFAIMRPVLHCESFL